MKLRCFVIFRIRLTWLLNGHYLFFFSSLPKIFLVILYTSVSLNTFFKPESWFPCKHQSSLLPNMILLTWRARHIFLPGHVRPPAMALPPVWEPLHWPLWAVVSVCRTAFMAILDLLHFRQLYIPRISILPINSFSIKLTENVLYRDIAIYSKMTYTMTEDFLHATHPYLKG